MRAVVWPMVLSSTGAVALAGWVASLPQADRVSAGAPHVAAAGGGSLAWVLVGSVLVTLRPRNVLGWLFLVLGTFAAWQVGLAAFGGYGVVVAQPSWPGANLAAAVGSVQFVPAMFAAPTVVLAFYPNGRLASRSSRWSVAAAATAITLMTLTLPFAPDAVEEIAPGHAPSVALPSGVVILLLVGVCLPLMALATLAIWVSAIRRMMHATSPDRQQLAWFVCAAGPLLAVICVDAPEPVVAVCVCLVPVVVAVGVLRYRLLGITALMRRGLVYGSLTALVIAIYLALTNAIGAISGLGSLPGVLATSMVATGLAPARERLRRTVDWWIFGAEHDPLHALTRLGDQLADGDEHDLLPAAVDAVMQALHAPSIRVTADDGTVLAAMGPTASSGHAVELRLAGRALGTMTVGDRADGEAYTRDDMRLLQALAQQIAAVVQAHQLAAAVAAHRNQVLDATAAERNRMREDLQNQLGPSLAGMGLGLQAALDGLARGDADVVGPLLARTLNEVTATVGEIRGIIDSLRCTNAAPHDT